MCPQPLYGNKKQFRTAFCGRHHLDSVLSCLPLFACEHFPGLCFWLTFSLLEIQPIFFFFLIKLFILCWSIGFPGSSAGKESTCNAGDPSLISGSGRSPGEGIGYPLQYSWASMVAQTVKNPPEMKETWDGLLGWEDSVEEGKATHSSILAWRSSWTEEPGGLQFIGLQRVGHDWVTKHSTAQPVNNVMTVSGGQQRDSVMHIHVHVYHRLR